MIVNEHFEKHYKIKGVGISNLYDAFNPILQEVLDFTHLRSNLLKNGMSRTYVNKLIEDWILYLSEFGRGPFKIH